MPDGQALAWANGAVKGLVLTSLSGDGKQRSLPFFSAQYRPGFDVLAFSP